MTNPFEQIMQELAEIKEKLNNMPPAAAVVPPEIIDTEELCKRLAITRPTVNKLRKKKKLPVIPGLGANSIRYNWPAVVSFLEKSKPNN